MTQHTQAQAEQAVERAADYFQTCYLDYWSDFLTIGGYASYYGIAESEAEKRIRIGRKIHNHRTKEPNHA